MSTNDNFFPERFSSLSISNDFPSSNLNKLPIAITLPPSIYPASKPYTFFTTLLHRYGRYDRIRSSMVYSDSRNVAGQFQEFGYGIEEAEARDVDTNLTAAFSAAFPTSKMNVREHDNFAASLEVKAELARLAIEVENISRAQKAQQAASAPARQNTQARKPQPPPLAVLMQSNKGNTKQYKLFSSFMEKDKPTGILTPKPRNLEYEPPVSPISGTLERKGFGDIDKALDMMFTSRLNDQRVSLKPKPRNKLPEL
ncbi:hypothetical protein HK098_003915 [Nowakowskiella sp. JEL0407]|nr:hypothetical protein HK098_003915 [Nowakowskiella sp. JEL0407]